MRKSILTTYAFLVASMAMAGCGTDAALQSADASPTVSFKPGKPPPPTDPAEDYKNDSKDSPEEIALWELAHQRLRGWLRSDYVKNVDPRSLSQARNGEFFPESWSTFEEAVDFGDLVVSGQVKDLLFVPRGTVTTFQVDRTAKGEPKSTIYIMQQDFIEPDDGNSLKTNNAQIIYDPNWPTLFKGDHVVLALKRIPEPDAEQVEFIGDRLGGAPLYEVVRGHGEYMLANDKVASDKNNTPVTSVDREFDGKSEDELMDTAEAYAKDNRVSYKSPSPSAS